MLPHILPRVWAVAAHHVLLLPMSFVVRQLYAESLKKYILYYFYYFEVIGDSEATIGRGFVGLDYCIQDLSSRLASL